MYLNDWKDGGLVEMVGDFEDIYITKSEYEATSCQIKNVDYWLDNKKKMTDALASDKYAGIDVLLASYTYENYNGDAFVLFKRNGKLYEVNGSHCSCYWLEGQWEPEETTAEALRHRLDNGALGGNEYSGNIFANELRQVIDVLQPK